MAVEQGFLTSLHAPDGKPVVLPNLFESDVQVNFTGVADDITDNVRFGGAAFAVGTASVESKAFTWQFNEWVYLAGGVVGHTGGIAGDSMCYQIIAPATAGSSNPGAGDYDKVDIGGGNNIYVPVAADTGDWDLNLTEKLNGNVGFTKVVPVKNAAQTGYFNWDPATEAVTVVSNPAAPDGGYDLFDFEIVLSNFVKNVSLPLALVAGFMVPAVRPRRLLPHWQHKVLLHNSTAKQVDLSWMLFLGRKYTQD